MRTPLASPGMSTTQPAARGRRAGAAALVRRHWGLLPFVAAGIYLLVVLLQLGPLLGWAFHNSDAAAGPVIGSLIGDAPANRDVWLGNYPWYESLWFMAATKGLPAHRQIW